MSGSGSSSDGETDSSSQGGQAEKVLAQDVKEANAGPEVILLQENGFNIKIVAPGQDPFEIPVSLIFLFLKESNFFSMN